MPKTTCCVPGCCKRGGFFFPVNIDLRRQWLEAIQRSNWVPKDNSTVCRDHFTRHDYVTEDGVTGEKLKKNVVPNVFWWTNDNQSKSQPVGVRKITESPSKRVSQENSDSAEEEEIEEDFEDAGARLDESDEEFRPDNEIQEDSDIEPEIEPVSAKPIKPRKSLKTPKSASKAVLRKHKLENEDILLNTNKRPKLESMSEYSKQLNKAYQEISRLSARNQVLDAALKNKSLVTHRSRTLYQIGKYVMPHQLSFIEAQAVNSNLPPSMRRWSRRMRNICLGLYRHSKHAYGYMAKIFAMPTEEDLQKWGVQNTDINDNGVSNIMPLVEADALVDEVTFDNLMSIVI